MNVDIKNMKTLSNNEKAALLKNAIKESNTKTSISTPQQQPQQSQKLWDIGTSTFANETLNPVRQMIEQMVIEPNPAYPMIALSIGDPTVFSQIGKPETVQRAMNRCIKEKKYDGYTASYGTQECREAVAKYYSRPESVIYSAKDIILTSGCSQAIDLCITVLANKGQNILIPAPGFSIYKTLCGTLGVNVKYYHLLENSNWEIDLNELEEQVDENTVGIIVNNPSNPCGSVYSTRHLAQIVQVAQRHKLPIIADEVYGDMAFKGQEFSYMSEVSDDVPILSCNSLSKRFILPGWRFGWVAVHDPRNHLQKVRAGFNDLTTRLLGPNSLVQAAIPEILQDTTQEYYDGVMETLATNAEIVYERLSCLPGLRPKRAQGAMYLMVGLDIESFPGIKDDMEFAQMMIKEQSVFCLPASIFEMPNYIRVVCTMEKSKIMEACDRIEQFVRMHYKKLY